MAVQAASTTVVPAAELRSFAARVARTVGVPEEDATTIADGMVWTELRGVDIGIKRLTTLVSRIRAGGTRADPRPAVIRESASLAVLEGHEAWGQVTSVRAMRLAIAKAKSTGVGACVVRDTGNSLAMGYYPWLATQDRKSTRLNSKSPYDLVCRLLLEKKKSSHISSRPIAHGTSHPRSGYIRVSLSICVPSSWSRSGAFIFTT